MAFAGPSTGLVSYRHSGHQVATTSLVLAQQPLVQTPPATGIESWIPNGSVGETFAE